MRDTDVPNLLINNISFFVPRRVHSEPLMRTFDIPPRDPGPKPQFEPQPFERLNIYKNVRPRKRSPSLPVVQQQHTVSLGPFPSTRIASSSPPRHLRLPPPISLLLDASLAPTHATSPPQTLPPRQIYVDPQHPTVFAIGMDLRNRHPQCDVLFRAPDVGSRDKWLRAIADAVTRSSVELAELGD